jgi:hypothetical protein
MNHSLEHREQDVHAAARLLVRRLRDMSTMLALDAVVRPGAVDPIRLATAVHLVGGLADQLTRRIGSSHPCTRHELVDIAGEAVEIIERAARPAVSVVRLRAFLERVARDVAA